MTSDRELYPHKEWLGLLQPVGLVVSPVALAKSQALIDRTRAVELQPRLEAVLDPDADAPRLRDFPAFAREVLEWEPEDLAGAPGQPPVPPDLEVPLPDYGETLRPAYAVPDPDAGEAGPRWLLLVGELPPGTRLDDADPDTGDGRGWRASPQAKFERLLRETGVPAGLLCNGSELRLVCAPRGESSGHLTFPVAAMTEVAGRPILAALEMLLGADRLFVLPRDRRLPKILADSRSFQAEVSTRLAGQVLDALWELVRGFQIADASAGGRLLGDLIPRDLRHVYGGAIATLMRLVFLLYAEDEGLMPDEDTYQRNYAVSGLYERLRDDAGNHPDTMDDRYGAWAGLLSLFRLVYDGGGPRAEYLPARHGQLFDPDEYPFLEGRPLGGSYATAGTVEVPRISDGTIYRILDKLLILDGERLSYRALDVEQIGSVYEAVVGYEVEVAEGASVAVRPEDVVVNVEALLAVKPKDRAKWLKDAAECNITGKGATALKAADTPEAAVAALDRKLSPRTPDLLPAGSLYLQPGEERRRTGSHYTPRKLTAPIVATALRPVLEALGDRPTPEQILALKVCDPAMGSAAFLVEACRQLAEKLVEAWECHGFPEDFPTSVEPLLSARRLVAQRCLYGVDKNPFAVNLAKLSLWLVTLAKDLPFTFVDHALKCGDSLVGLTQKEIGGFGRDPIADLPLIQLLKERVERARSLRSQIQTGDTRSDADAENKWVQLQTADRELQDLRLVGDVAVAAFFDGAGKKKKEAKELRESYESAVAAWRRGESAGDDEIPPRLASISERLRSGKRAVVPFNWEVEFPEVFDRENSGFDAIVGNPPFAGKNTTISAHPEGYLDWLKVVHPESHGNSDIVAHFFRRAFTIIRDRGTFGLIATNTIAQGNTRNTGLRFICNNGGTIYNAQKRVKWPGLAAVVVSVVNIIKGDYPSPKILDNRTEDKVTAFLFHKGGNDDPKVLLANANKSFQGSIVLGMGFTFDDNNPDATPIAEMHRLIEKDPRNAERIFPYIGGDEVNSSPTHSHHRYVINFGEMSEDEARQWPNLMEIVEEKVKPKRLKDKRASYKKYWWQYAEKRVDLFKAIAECDRVLVISAQAYTHFALAFLSSNQVFSHALCVISIGSYSGFCTLQSRVKEIWARFFGSSLEDRLRYTPSDCFETFPFPENWETDPNLEKIGKEYYEYRAELMIRKNEGLTATYNRFHDPEETDPDILKLRQLHEQMDRAVLDAYNWRDIETTCRFALDYLDIDEGEKDLPEAVANRIETGDYFFPTADEAATFDSLVRTGKRKLPWRYRWPEATHDEVLARLLLLNEQRHQEEVLGGKQKKRDRPRGQGKNTRRKKPAPDNPTIPGL